MSTFLVLSSASLQRKIPDEPIVWLQELQDTFTYKFDSHEHIAHIPSENLLRKYTKRQDDYPSFTVVVCSSEPFHAAPLASLASPT